MLERFFNKGGIKMTEEQKKELAIFRFGIISEFVTGMELPYGEKEKLLNEKSKRFYSIPFSSKKSIAKSSILCWIRTYNKGGKRIEALYPRPRKDKGKFRKLDENICQEIKNLRTLRPNLTVPMMIKILKQNKVLSMDENIRLPSIYRYLKSENLKKINTGEPDKRKFEAEFPNQVWQGDVMHGPKVRINGVNKKSYLNAFIDDHSRFIIHAEFFADEKLSSLKDCLRQAICKKGLPQKLYVDNGSCYSAINLDQITACLGIGITHSRPYTPQGRGKIERWFKSIREGFLPLYPNILSIENLNLRLDEWVDEYNNKIHSSIMTTPSERHSSNIECLRSAPEHLMDYFRLIKTRKINKDRTIRLNGKIYEGPTVLIDRRVDLKYHDEDQDAIEVFFQGKSYGMAQLLNVHINSRVGRDYKNKSGELFNGDKK